MPSENEQQAKPTSAAEHIAGAHRLMTALKQRIGEHPELEEAIHNLEMALSILTVNTAGML